MIDFKPSIFNGYVIIALLIVPQFLFGQTSDQKDETDKIVYSIPGVSQNQLESVLKGDLDVSSILPLVEKLFAQTPDEGVLLVDELLLSEKVKENSREWAILLYYKTEFSVNYFITYEELEFLQENLEQCISFFKRKKMQHWLAKSYSLLSNISFHHSFNNNDFLYEKASSANEKALKIALEIETEFPASYSILGEIYRIKGNICLQKNDCPIDLVMADYNIALRYVTLNKDETGQSKILIDKALVLAKLEQKNFNNESIENPIRLFEKAISISSLPNDQINAQLEYAIYLQNKYHLTFDQSWNRKSNNQLIMILNHDNGRKTEAYFQFAANYQSLLSYTADDLTDTEYHKLLDTVVLYYQKSIEASRLENNIRVYNEVFDRLATVCPYFPEEKCSELLIMANEVKSHYLQKNKSINEKITKRNEQFRMTIESQKRKGIWMNFAILSLISLFIFLYSFYRQKVQNLNSILAIKQEVLRAQMNPHFISNTINAIESLVNQRRNNEASEYLIDFSRLCRLVINHSRDSSISLQEEIETLKYFLSLEKLRLSDDLEYSISIDRNLNSDTIMVPPLILQPFIENAIWHGIKNKPEPKRGELKIEVNKISDRVIECIIEDNGVGRAKARELQKASVVDQKSWGTTLTQERIKFLDKDKDASLEIIDLVDSNNEARGTRVKIILPIRIKK